MMAKLISLKSEVKVSTFQAYDCYVTYNPGSVLAGGWQYEQRIDEDFKRLKSKVLNAPKVTPPRVNRGSVIGFDTEYASDAKLLTLAIADDKQAFAEEGTFEQVKALVQKAKVLCGHSITGDLDYLVRLGMARERWLRGLDIKDSFLLARMHDENRGKGGYGLETLFLSEFKTAPWKAETEALLKDTGNAADWTPEQRMKRCRMDAWATALLAKRFEEQLNAVL